MLANLQLGLLCARTGDRDELGRCISRLAERRLGGTWLGGTALAWLRARASLLDGQPEAAIPALEQAADRLSGFGIWHAEEHWLVLADALLCTGQRSRALALLERLQRRSRHDDQPQHRAAALGLEALLAQSDGRALLADTLMHRAQAMASGTLLGVALSEWLERWRVPGAAEPAAGPLATGVGTYPAPPRSDALQLPSTVPASRTPPNSRRVALAPAVCAIQEPAPGSGDCWTA